LIGIPCQDINGLDIGFLLITPLAAKADNIIVCYIYYSRGIGILVLEDNPVSGFSFDRCMVD
jgi:hypothetical protein